MAVRARHQFPLRAGAYLAQVMCPPDMTMEEALELCAFVRSLVGRNAKHGASAARAENRFFAETRPQRASALHLWRVAFDVVTHKARRKPRFNACILLVSAPDARSATNGALAQAEALYGPVIGVEWHSTQLVRLPLDLAQAMPTPQTMRAAERGYRAGLLVGYVQGATSR